MRKATVLFTLMLTIGLLCGGAVFADGPSGEAVDVTVYDENGDPVEVAECGDVVTVEVDAYAGDVEEWYDPVVFITVPDDLLVDVEGAVMWDDVSGEWWANDDPIFGGFFYWNEDTNCYVWEVGWNNWFGEFAVNELYFDALVDKACGPPEIMAVQADLVDVYDYEVTDTGWYPTDWETFDVDQYAFLAVCPCPGPCVPMQPTGAPAALAALALVGMIGGTLYTRLR